MKFATDTKHMKRFCLSFILFLGVTISWADDSDNRQKIILDTDMVELFDDGIAMMMLAKAPNIDLLGVTVVAGNTWVSEGTAYAIRQLEAIGITDIPVLQGVRLSFAPNRVENMREEIQLFGFGEGYSGSFAYEEPTFWKDVYTSRYKQEPTFGPTDMHAVNFIIEQVKRYPHEVTILAIGPCCNLAMAVRMAPEIIPLIKRVVYMGGAFTVPGNTTPAAEFNWWYDPEAARIALRSPFKEQIVVGLDVCNQIELRKDRYERIVGLLTKEKFQAMLHDNFLQTTFEERPETVWHIWDIVAAALCVEPSILKREMTRHIDINTQQGLSYGQSLAFTHNPPTGTQPVRIVIAVDEKRLWQLIEESCRSF